MLEYHINQKADITVGYTKLAAGQDDPTRFGVMQMDTDGRVLSFEEKPVVTDNMMYQQVSILSEEGSHWTFGRGPMPNKDMTLSKIFLSDIVRRRRFMVMKCRGIGIILQRVDSYYRTNMDFLKKDVRDYFFGGYASIYSKVEDQPPAKFNPGASVRNSPGGQWMHY